jgi:phosphomannomutase
MYGSGADIYGLLFNSKKIVAINTEIDPLFGEINSPEPVESKLSKLKEFVKKEKAICGFALDGDGDRFTLVDEKGNYFTPQKAAPMILNYLVEKKNMKGRVVQAVSLGYLTQRIAREKNFIFEFTPVGFKYIAYRISMGDTIFGAEESGGYCWKGNIPERDGFMTSLIFLEMISEMGLSITKIYENIKNKYGDSYFIREDLHVEKIPFSKYSYAVKIKSKLPKTILNKNIKEVLTLDGIKVILENDWWFLIRPSGTEPLIRIYAEAENEKSVKDLIKFAKEISVI